MTTDYRVTVKDDNPDHLVIVKDASTPAHKVTSINGQGPPGLSAYQVALNNGFVGTTEEWIESLRGSSAYEVALSNGFVGSEEEWLESLKANINISPEVAGFVLSNDGADVVWQTLEQQLNESNITWDLGDIV